MAKMTLDELVARGFDNSFEDDEDEDGAGGIEVRCSQCEASVINGVACHERGCPNTTHECAECGAQTKMRLCDDCYEDSDYFIEIDMGSEGVEED